MVIHPFKRDVDWDPLRSSGTQLWQPLRHTHKKPQHNPDNKTFRHKSLIYNQEVCHIEKKKWVRTYFLPLSSSRCQIASLRPAPPHPKAWKSWTWNSCRGASCRWAGGIRSICPAARPSCYLHPWLLERREPAARAAMRTGQQPGDPMDACFGGGGWQIPQLGD